MRTALPGVALRDLAGVGAVTLKSRAFRPGSPLVQTESLDDPGGPRVHWESLLIANSFL